MKKRKLDVVFILDKSGSMSGSEDSTISSFNEYLEKEKNSGYNTFITTVLFSDNSHYLHKRENICNIQKITKEDYIVSGCTALFDALGHAINYIDSIKTDKVLFIIITDGYENASREFTKEKIRKMITSHSNFEFIYIGADIDSYTAGSNIGIRKDNIANYQKNKKGTSLLFESVSNFEMAMMKEESQINWKEKLDNYIKKTTT